MGNTNSNVDELINIYASEKMAEFLRSGNTSKLICALVDQVIGGQNDAQSIEDTFVLSELIMDAICKVKRGDANAINSD